MGKGTEWAELGRVQGAMAVAVGSPLFGEGHQPGLTLTPFSPGESPMALLDPLLTAPSLVKRGLNAALIQV